MLSNEGKTRIQVLVHELSVNRDADRETVERDFMEKLDKEMREDRIRQWNEELRKKR